MADTPNVNRCAEIASMISPLDPWPALTDALEAAESRAVDDVELVGVYAAKQARANAIGLSVAVGR